MSYDAPFAGLRVVDISQGIAGPYCGMLLAQYGADVVKVEPTEGDWSRTLGTIYGDHTAFSIAGNLGKRSIGLDLKAADGKEILGRLIDRADVFIEGFRPGVADRLGFGHAAASARNPRLLYVSVSGFGQDGPLAGRPAMDPVLQAFTGMMTSNAGNDGIPHRVNFIPVDMTTGLYTFQAVSTALYARRDEATGRYIENSLMRSAAAIQIVRMMATWLEKGEMRPGLTPSGVFPAGEGWLSITVLREKDFAPLCMALERPAMAEDARFATNPLRTENIEALTAAMVEALSARTARDWSNRLTEIGILHEVLNDYADYLKSEQVAATGAIHWLDQPGVPEPVPVPSVAGLPPLANGSFRGTAPTLGQHTGEILGELGYDRPQVADLATRHVVAVGTAPARTDALSTD